LQEDRKIQGGTQTSRI